MYQLQLTSQFKKDLKKIKNNKKRLKKVLDLIDLLIEGGVGNVPIEMRPHKLIGNWNGRLECHIESDYLIIWFEKKNPNIIRLERVGSHSELFE
ncbi:type II toxin-antitoxin system YafQ family toxin [Myroides odoratimimus]|uniref:type II toxin-antitoxin system RelE/ParE family toxin n=1 Tax=Myroides odoratimimus TaxID=76832 RepID=UPI00091AFEBD|nr:type II toxin-antitoxin system YafQ family toxin [Myroides odoratimimus]SHM41959.1 mRNA interferase YafQ [Myroides odoratimimus subsp. xuanwuensis]